MKSMTFTLLFFCLVLGSTSQVVAATTDKTKFTSADIFDLEYASDPRVSPDGTKIIFVRRSYDIMTDSVRSNLWIADTSGNNLRPLLTGKKNYYAPRWSPDGTRLAYLSNKEGKTQLFVRWMDTGQTAMLTNVQRGLSTISWSPDGQTIAFTMSIPKKDKALSVKMPPKPKGAKWNAPFTYVTKARYQADGRGILEPAFTHIFTVPAIGGTPKQLTTGDFNHRGSISWSRDSQSLYFVANRNQDWEYESREADIFKISLSGKLFAVTSAGGVEYSPALSPDGQKLAYLAFDNKKLAYRPQLLKILDLKTGETRTLLSSLDRGARSIQWDKKGKGLYFQNAVRGDTTVGYVSLEGEISTIATGLSGTTLGRPYLSGSFHTNGSVIALTKGTTHRPADVHVIKGKTSKVLTALNEDVLGHKKLGDVKEFTYKSSIDGEEIHGWYILPPDYDPQKKYPLITEIHGGPHLAYGPVFTAELQRFAAEGYIVFYNNYRGSSSYGERFALLLQYKYSSKYDFADHMSGIDALIDKGIVDADRLFVAGGSAGGIASAYAIGLTDRFKAAAVAKPVINWLSKVLTADSYLSQIPNQFPGMPWDHVEHYWQRSPLSLVKNVVTPTLLITGEQDRRTPMSETEQFYQALKLRRIDTIMVRVPGSAHGIAARPSRMIGKIENILAWFKKYDSPPKKPEKTESD